MKEILSYYLLNGKKEWKDKKVFDGDDVIDMDSMFGTARSITKEVIFDVLFEDPYEDLVTTISLKAHDFCVDFGILFRDAFYEKHIGKFVDGEETLKRLKEEFNKRLSSVCWRKLARGGVCDG